MNCSPLILFVVLVAWVHPALAEAEPAGQGGCCTPAWYRSIENRAPTGDGQGHGPDLGSAEWRSVVAHRIGLRDQADGPRQDSEDWCRRVDQIVREAEESAKRSGKAPAVLFPRNLIKAGGMEAMIHADPELSALDRELAMVAAIAAEKAVDAPPPLTQAEQWGWGKDMDECRESADQRGCVRKNYTLRIAELQARYRLAPFLGPYRFACDGISSPNMLATFFKTDPPALIVEYGGETAFMIQQPSASGAKYQGANAAFWAHQGEAMVTWGQGQPSMRCQQTP
ncbi:MAG: MliC family protein [Desulfobulbus sp.]|nr:MliC family protein [Desulfobulbus sp.]